MSRIALDLNQFSHVKTDYKATTLRHKDGHLLKIAHAALPKPSQEQLKALSKVPASDETTMQSAEMRNQIPMKNGGSPAHPEGDSDQTVNRDLPPDVAQGLEQGAQGVGRGWFQPTSGTSILQNLKDAFKNPQQNNPQAPPQGYDEGGDVKKPDTLRDWQKETARKNKEYAIQERQKKSRDAMYPKPPKKAMAPINSPSAGTPEDSVTMMAYGGGPDPVTSPIAPTSQNNLDGFDMSTPISQLPPQATAANPLLQVLQNYNAGVGQQVSQQKQDAVQQGVPQDLANQAAKQQYGTQTFGPNGQKPQDFNAAAFQASQQQALQQQNSQLQANATQQASNSKDQTARAQAGLPVLPVGGIGQPPIPGSENTDPGPNASSGDLIDTEMNAPLKMYQQGMNNTMQGEQGLGQAQGALGQAQSQALTNTIPAEQKVYNQLQNTNTTLTKEFQSMYNDASNGHIDPNQYWTGDANGNGGHSKIAAAIGLILGGIGGDSGPTSAAGMLQYQMDKNIQAQQANMTNKQNLL